MENSKFLGADTLLEDSDGDEESDGQEVYETLTNLLLVDYSSSNRTYSTAYFGYL